MVIKVGINSFGRIGRVIFRTCCENSEIEVSAINEPAIDLDYMCYLIKFDSTHGKYAGNVSRHGDEIQVNDSNVKVFRQSWPSDIPWDKAQVQYVIEASGMFTNLEKASGHLTSAGVRKVVITAPSADAPMIILGVNDDIIQPEINVISCASSTLYCLAPIVKVLEDTYGVTEGFVTSIHAMTPSLKPLDGMCVRSKHWRDHRSIHQNIIPGLTSACKALGKIIPSCKGKLAGLAFRVPIVNVSLLDISVRLNKSTTIQEITQTIDQLKNPLLRSIIQVSNEKTVSSDFIGDMHSCTLDTDSCLQIAPNFFKLVCWYENEFSYSCRVVDTVLLWDAQVQMQCLPPITKITYPRISYFGPMSCTPIGRKKGSIDIVPFPLTNLQSTESNFKPGLQTLTMRPITQCISPTNELKKPNYPKDTPETMKCNIDKVIKSKYDKTQDKIRSLRNRSPPAEGTGRANVCLKKVEEDISEMLTMTEDLINKSSHKRLQALPSIKRIPKEEAERELKMLRENIIKKISDTITKIRKEKFNSNVKLCGDYKPLLTLHVNDYQDKTSVTTQETNRINASNSSKSHEAVPSIKNVRSNFLQKRSNNILLNHLRYPLKKSKEQHITEDSKLHTTVENKTLVKDKIEYVEASALVDRTSDYKRDDGEDENELIVIVSDNLEPIIECLNKHPVAKSNAFPGKPQKTDDIISRDEVEITTCAHEVVGRADVVNISRTETELNIIEPFSVKTIEQEASGEVETVFTSALHIAENHDDKVKGKDNTVLHEAGKLSSENLAFPGCSSNQTPCGDYLCKSVYIPEDGSLSDGVSDTPSESRKRKDTLSNIQDLYDKLDSNSVSESENSYRMHEKKSQVIDITDFKYSLENLARLDKICKVIEISDELSDKLFSPLISESSQKPPGQKWSFQDFCERIKVDDFFNELFEKSAS